MSLLLPKARPLGCSLNYDTPLVGVVFLAEGEGVRIVATRRADLQLSRMRLFTR